MKLIFFKGEKIHCLFFFLTFYQSTYHADELNNTVLCADHLSYC